jgi:hypothetical protein
LYTFGGLQGQLKMDDLLKLDSGASNPGTGVIFPILKSYSTGSWSVVNVSAPSGLARWRHTAVQVDGMIWVFGGLDEQSLGLSTVFCYDIGTPTFDGYRTRASNIPLAANTWRPVNSGGPQRYGHTAVLTVDSKAMIVFGGEDGQEIYADAWLFHFGTELRAPSLQHRHLSSPTIRNGEVGTNNVLHFATATARTFRVRLAQFFGQRSSLHFRGSKLPRADE